MWHKPTHFISVCLLCLLGCGEVIEGFITPPALAPGPAPTHGSVYSQLAAASAPLLAEIEAVGTRCAQTGGSWRKYLHSCRCPAHRVFLVEQGCVAPFAPDFDGLLALQEQMRDGNDATLSTTLKDFGVDNHFKQPLAIGRPHHWVGLYFSPEDTLNFLKAYSDSDATRLLNDISFNINPHISTYQDILREDSLLQHKLRDYGAINASRREDFTVRAYVDIRGNTLKTDFSAEKLLLQCGKGLKDALAGQDVRAWFSESMASFCEELSHVLAWIHQEEEQGQPVKVVPSERLARSYKPHCWGTCWLNVDLQTQHAVYSYDVVMNGYVAVQRRLSLHLSQKSGMVALLSPSGHLIHLTFYLLAPQPPSQVFSYRTNKIKLDGNFLLLSNKNFLFGNRQHLLMQAAVASFANWQLPMDSQLHTTDLPVAAAVLDDDFSLGSAEFNKRLAINHEAAQKFLASEVDRINLFTGEQGDFADLNLNQISESEMTALQENNVSADPPKFLHGNEVASVLMNDLPKIRVDLIGFSEYLMATYEPESSALRLCQRLKAKQTRVMVLPWGIEAYLPYCTQFFSAFAKACPEVLVIASSDNVDAELVGVSCPNGLDSYLENFVSVAGVDKRQRLDNSVYSKHHVTFGAPNEGSCLSTDFQSTEACYGTSIAAPIVGNAVLHLVARRPNLTPKQIIKILRKYCFSDQLPLRCGGAIDLETFFFNEVSPYSYTRPLVP